MSERSHSHHLLASAERYIRREDTILARGIRAISPKEVDSDTGEKRVLTGQAYLSSDYKRNFDRAVGTLAAIPATPLILAIAAVKFAEDRHNPFFTDSRMDPEGNPMNITKIRTMEPNADSKFKEAHGDKEKRKQGDSTDKRITRAGKYIRMLNFDELPQLWDVARGKTALVGNRTASFRTDEIVRNERPRSYANWRMHYKAARSGLFSEHCALEPHRRKESERRIHSDADYVKTASLNKDMFILAQVFIDMAGGIVNRQDKLSVAPIIDLEVVRNELAEISQASAPQSSVAAD